MKSYPKLLDDHGKYFFNLSIAEQTNFWFGAFHNICWEMTAVKYDFFWMRWSCTKIGLWLPCYTCRAKILSIPISLLNVHDLDYTISLDL